MTAPIPARRKDRLTKTGTQRFGDWLIAIGGFILFLVFLFGIKVLLASQPASLSVYLISSAGTAETPPSFYLTLEAPLNPTAPDESETPHNNPILPEGIQDEPGIEPSSEESEEVILEITDPAVSAGPTTAPETSFIMPEWTPAPESFIPYPEPTSAPEVFSQVQAPISPVDQPSDAFNDRLYLPAIVKYSIADGLDENIGTIVGPIASHGPSAGPVVRLVIPQIKVDRSVVPLDFRIDAGHEGELNTDALFANSNRSDLVGHLVTSVNPGDNGNIVLVGHNYNNGWNATNGVFVNLQKLSPGNLISIFTENGGEFQYVVKQVKKVPWRKQNSEELQKHQKFLWPTDHEQLTLVTCGGEVLFSWSARIYVVAVPVESQGD